MPAHTLLTHPAPLSAHRHSLPHLRPQPPPPPATASVSYGQSLRPPTVAASASYGCRLNALSYTAGILAAQRQGDSQLALDLYGEMEAAALPPNALAGGAAVTAQAARGDCSPICPGATC